MIKKIWEILKAWWNKLVKRDLGKEQAPEKPDIPWMDVALGDLALDWDEIPGEKSNPKVSEAFDVCGYKGWGDETAWCGVYVGSRLRICGYMIPSKCAWARNYTEKIKEYGVRLKEPKWGCVVNVERGSRGGTSHVGFLVGWDDESVRILGGNQSDNVTDSLVVPRSSVLSYNWPLKTV